MRVAVFCPLSKSQSVFIPTATSLWFISSFPPNLFLLSCFAVSSCCSSLSSLPHLSLFLPLISPCLHPFSCTSVTPVYLSLIPPSFSLKQKSWLQSYLQSPCSDANHDQKTGRTYISVAGCYLHYFPSSSRLPTGSYTVSARQQAQSWSGEKTQQQICLTLSWLTSTFTFTNSNSWLWYHVYGLIRNQPTTFSQRTRE